MEEAAELTTYLPVSYKSPKEEEYIKFLWDAFDTNFKHGKYQFAFLAYHMLTMSFVYFNIWQIKQTRKADFDMGIIGFAKDIEERFEKATSPFVFSTVGERSMLRFLKLIKCDNEKIGKYGKLVVDRNDTAHPNGNIFYSTEAALAIKVREVLRVVDEIQTHSTDVVTSYYRDFLLKKYTEEEWQYPDPFDQVREILVHETYSSLQDIKICAAFQINTLANEPNFAQAQVLHQTLLEKYGPELEALA